MHGQGGGNAAMPAAVKMGDSPEDITAQEAARAAGQGDLEKGRKPGENVQLRDDTVEETECFMAVFDA
eukprot:2984685-Rhodomonas_salina.1